MIIGKAVNLRVRPVQSADLCYPVDGLICDQPAALLGSPVRGLNIESLYLVLLETVEGDDSRVLKQLLGIAGELVSVINAIRNVR